VESDFIVLHGNQGQNQIDIRFALKIKMDSEIQASLISKSNFIFESMWFPCGAAESRTPVQKKHLKTFYMLSLFLDFRPSAGVQATNARLIFLIFKIHPKRRTSIPNSVPAVHLSLYTIVGLSDILLQSAKSYAMLILN